MYVMFSLFYIVFYIYVKVVVVNGQKCRFRPQISIASPATSTSITLKFYLAGSARPSYLCLH